MALIYLSLGSNIGRQRHINAALDALAEYFGELTISSVYESESVGFAGDNFYNLVVGINTGMAVGEVSKSLAFYLNENGTNEVEDQERESLKKSIGAVPTYIINNQYILQGGQQPETFVAFLRKIQSKEIEKQNVQ